MLLRLGTLQVEARFADRRQVERAVNAHAAAVRRAGLTEGAHVGVWTQPALETLIALVGNAQAGVVSVPLDPKLGPLELGHIAGDARPVATFAANPSEVEGRLPGAPLHQALLAEADGPSPTRAVDDRPLLVLYTSGTTGLPKGAVISARNVASNLDALAAAWGWTHDDTVVHSLPVFHVHGLVLGLFGAMRTGGGLQWLPRFEPAATARALRAAPRSMLFAVPTMYHRLAEACSGDPSITEGLRAARVLVSGSAALPLRDQQRIEQLTGRRVLERYGLTETLINCAVRVDGERVAGRVGAALEGVEVRLIDDARQPLPSRDDTTIGEVQVRGPNVFHGYLNRPEATAAVLDADGWFSTGDLATMRPDGSLRIVGRRATDLIKCGGYKVGAGEVEAALLEHPAVREVAVVGVPDDDLGERIVAFVVVNEAVAPEALQQFVAAQLSPHKRPRTVTLVDALPRNAMGKVLKAKLR